MNKTEKCRTCYEFLSKSFGIAYVPVIKHCCEPAKKRNPRAVFKCFTNKMISGRQSFFTSAN